MTFGHVPEVDAELSGLRVVVQDNCPSTFIIFDDSEKDSNFSGLALQVCHTEIGKTRWRGVKELGYIARLL